MRKMLGHPTVDSGMSSPDVGTKLDQCLLTPLSVSSNCRDTQIVGLYI